MNFRQYSPIFDKQSTINELKNHISDYDTYLDSQFSNNAITDTLKSRSQFFDALLVFLWNKNNLAEKNISLNAIGGYGRETLHPYSDIDIYIGYDSNITAKDEQCIQSFLHALWDLNLNLGHSVSSLKECFALCKEDLSHATSLMEIRSLAGPCIHEKNILETLHGDHIYDSRSFFKGKLKEQQERHKKSGKIAYNIEPNIKTNPGGLRDVQTLTWVACKHYGTTVPQALRRIGFFTQDEYSELMECQHFLWRIRWALHKVTNRAENRLLLNYQADVAQKMGFGGEGNVPIEKMMRQVFRAKKRIYELNRMLMSHLERNILAQDKNYAAQILNDEFEILDGYINARNEDVFIEFKQIIIMFRLIAEHSEAIKGIAPETLRLLRQVRRRLLGDLQDFQDCRSEFIAIFKHRHGMGLALTLMHQYGILAAYLPQWREIEGQMQFDLFHAYTVDEHTHKLLKNLYYFETSQEQESLKIVANLYRQLNNKDTLLIAALFHDLAKGRGGDHSELGAVDVEQFAHFHELKPSQTKTIVWLVKNHLLMSTTSQRMDIYNPDIITGFAKQVKTEARLDMLYCLTVADIQATNDNLWSDWKATLLSDLYYATKQALRNGLENILELRSLVRERKLEAIDKLKLTNQEDLEPEIKLLWKNLPISFFSNADADEIARYSIAILEFQASKKSASKPLIMLDKNTDKGCSDLFVYTRDKSGVFVALFNTLANLKISVRQAQISLTKDHYVIELLKITDHDNLPIKTLTRRKQVLDKLKGIFTRDLTKPIKMTSFPKQEKCSAVFNNIPTIEYLQTRQPGRTLLSVSALETPEFMGRIAESFRTLNLNIHSARISTIGERVDNVFAISNKEGRKLTLNEQKELNTLLVENITI